MTAFGLAPRPASAAPASAAIVEDAPPEPHGILALWKSFSWRAIDSALAVGSAYIVTGSTGVAGAIMILNQTSEAITFYFHELFWLTRGSGSRASGAITGLPPAGIDG